ncbi:MAG: tautomerase family protein [Rubrivivax sp.]|nr:tautomerase family protein [Rubrivivax sp.]
MPLVTLTVHQALPAAQRRQWLDAIHQALVAVGVPQADRFQRVLALAPDDLVVDAHYPEPPGSPHARDHRFVLAEVLWSVGRSVKLKRQFLQQLNDRLRESELEPEQLMLVFKETAWENWSFAGGRLLHA